jgi:hypothetical protein
VLHHDRKASAEDFISTVSGTNAIAGAADTVLVLGRKRGQDEAILQVTGRDVHEGAYAMTFAGGAWVLDGADLEEAAQVAMERQNTSGLGDRSAAIVAFVARHPAGVRAADVAEQFDMPTDQVRPYLGRLADSGRIDRASRGLYVGVTSVTSVTSTEEDGPERNTRNGRNTSPEGAGGRDQEARSDTSDASDTYPARPPTRGVPGATVSPDASCAHRYKGMPPHFCILCGEPA